MHHSNLKTFVFGGLFVAMSLFGSGCAHPVAGGNALAWIGSAEEYKPQNFHQASAWLPRDLRRVAVMPLTTGLASELPETSLTQLEQLVPGELTRTELFEVVNITPDQLRRWTGKSRWSITDELPPSLLERIHSQLGCDGVIFTRLTAYHPYPPMVMGWKMHLVDTREPHVWWACDLVYDAGNQGVVRSAVRYESEHQGSRTPTADPATILRSPGRFGQYTLAASLATMQRHEKNN